MNANPSETNDKVLWKQKLAQYLRGKLVDPTNPNYTRWLERDESYISSHTAGVIQILQNESGTIDGLRIIDFGCGAGLDAINLARAGAVVTGVDIDPDLVEIAQTRAKEEGVQARFLTVGDRDGWYRSAQFDALVAIDVLEHLEEPIHLIRDCWYLLRLGGIAIFSTPNRWALPNVIADPHWRLFGVTLLPRFLAQVYVTQMRRVLREYDMTNFIGLPALRAMMLDQGFVLLHDNIIDMAEKWTIPSNVSGNFKRLLAKVMSPLAKIKSLRTLMSWLYCYAFTRTWQIVIKKPNVES